jgi:hypothetical protein
MTNDRPADKPVQPFNEFSPWIFTVPIFLFLPLVPVLLLMAPPFLMDLVDIYWRPPTWVRTSFSFLFYLFLLPSMVLVYAFQLVAAVGFIRRKAWASSATTSCLRIYRVVLLLMVALFLFEAFAYSAIGHPGASTLMGLLALASTVGATLAFWISRRMKVVTVTG